MYLKRVLSILFLLSQTTFSGTTNRDTHIQTDVTFEKTEKEKRKNARKRIATEKKEKKETRKTFNTMSYQELVAAKENYARNGNTQSVIRALESILKVCTDVEKRADYVLELADLHLQEKKYTAAALLYSEFMLFYQGHAKLEYASFQAIVCSFSQILSPDRDQTQTKLTLEFIENYLENATFNQYKSQVLQMQAHAQTVLFESQKNICNFYITHNKYASGDKIVERMRQQWLLIDPLFEKDILSLEIALLEKKNNLGELERKKQELTTKFPDLELPVYLETQPLVLADAQKDMKQRF